MLSEEFAQFGDTRLCFSTSGDAAGEPLVLIMGLGFQLIDWPQGFCDALAGEGFHVIRFDNRDAGRSTHFPGADYTLDEMAADVVGLLDHLGVEAAHLVGASLGGMVAQVVAARHPQRVRSLASLMSSTGAKGVGGVSRSAMLRLLPAMFVRGDDAAAERRVRVFRAVGSTAFEHDEHAIREASRIGATRDDDHRGGRRRQQAAVKRSGDRSTELASVTAPTVVIHGTADKLVDPSGGRATAAAIPGARLVEIDGLGHDLPPGAWSQLVRAIAANAGAAARP